MDLNFWRRWLNPLNKERFDRGRLGRTKFRPTLEGLECRIVPAITLTKTAAPPPGGASSFTAGQNITYTIQLHEDVDPNTLNPDSNAQVSDVLPANTTFVSASQDPTNPTQFTLTAPAAGSSGTVRWTASSLPEGQTDTFTLVINISPPTNTGTISNTARFTSINVPAPGMSAPATVSVTSQADVGVAISAAPSPVNAGNNITYSVTVTNSGPGQADNVVLTDAVPSGATFVSEQQVSGPTFTVTNPAAGGTGTTMATITELPAGSTGTAVFQIVDHVPANTPNGTITNTANVSTTSSDPTPANNSATNTTTVAGSADLAVTKTGPATATAGSNLTYTVTLTNNGPSDAQSVSLTDATPAGTTFVSETHPTGFTSTTPAAGSTGTIMETATSFAAAGTATFTFVVKVNSSGGASTITNTATVSSSTPDPNPANNTSTAVSTAVSASADLAIVKQDHSGTAAPPTAAEGVPFTYFLTVTNNGPSDAQAVVVTDTVPAGVTINSISFPQGSQGTGSASNTFNLGTVTAGAQVLGTVVVTFSEEGSITDTATVSSTTPDPNTANNTSSVTDQVTEGTFSGTGVPVNGFESSALNNVTVGTFTHGTGAEAPGTMTATINWGDGSSSAGTIALANGTYTVTGSHTYTDERTFTVTVAVTDETGSVSITTSATILEELLFNGTRGTADQRFLNEVYENMLGRPIDASGLNTWTAELTAGTSRFQVVRDIQNASSLEYRGVQVQAIYHKYLHRAADPSGLQTGETFLQNGGTPEQLIDIVVSSVEYNQRTNGTNDGWLDVFYQDALGRAVDAAGRSHWDTAFANGASRAQVAGAILASDEYRQDLITSYYNQYLDRAPEAGGLANWLSAFDNFGATDDVVIAGIMTAQQNEFYNKTAR